MSEEPTKGWPIKKRLILEYVSQWDCPSFKREDIAKHVGLSVRQVGRYIADNELWEKAFLARRKGFARTSMAVDIGLINQAKKGVPQAARLYYEIFENHGGKRTMERGDDEGFDDYEVWKSKKMPP